MISRRSFLAALAGLPFVGKLIPQTYQVGDVFTISGRYVVNPDPWVPTTVCPEEGGGQIFITCGDQGYVFSNRCAIHDNCRLGDHLAEWDRKYQA